VALGPKRLCTSELDDADVCMDAIFYFQNVEVLDAWTNAIGITDQRTMWGEFSLCHEIQHPLH